MSQYELARHVTRLESPTKVWLGEVCRTYDGWNRVMVRLRRSGRMQACGCSPGVTYAVGDEVLAVKSRDMERPFVLAFTGNVGSVSSVRSSRAEPPAELITPEKPTNLRTYANEVMAIFVWRPCSDYQKTNYWYVVQRATDASGTGAETLLITSGSVFVNHDPTYTHYRVAGAVLKSSGLVRSSWSSWTEGTITAGSDSQVLTSDGSGFAWEWPAQVIRSLTNQSGSALSLGDVVIVDSANADSVTTTTESGYHDSVIGIALDSIADGSAGPILFFGYAPQVNLDSSASLGQLILTDTVAGQGTVSSEADLGCFGMVLGTGTTPAAMVWGNPMPDERAFRAIENADLPDPMAFKTAPSTLTISGGAVTATQNLHIIAAESGAEDDLDTVSGLTERQFLLIKADTGDTVTVKHATGNIHFDSGLDFDLEGDSWLLLWYDGANVVALGAGGGEDASIVTYTPAELTDWEGGLDPGDVDSALDQLASKVGNSSAGLLFSQVVDVEVVNTAVETSLLGAGRGSKTIPADDIDNGSIITYLLSGHGSTASEPSNLDITCKLGGSEICSTGMVSMMGSLTDFGFEIAGAITCRGTGATGSVIGYGMFHYGDGYEHDMAKISAVTVDTTSGLLLDVTAQWEGADADNEIICQEAEIRLIRADSLAVAAPSGLVAAEV